MKNLNPEESAALLSLLRATEQRGTAVRVHLHDDTVIRLFRSGRVSHERPGILRPTRVMYSNLDEWISANVHNNA
jgi:hypothetical protein